MLIGQQGEHAGHISEQKTVLEVPEIKMLLDALPAFHSKGYTSVVEPRVTDRRGQQCHDTSLLPFEAAAWAFRHPQQRESCVRFGKNKGKKTYHLTREWWCSIRGSTSFLTLDPISVTIILDTKTPLKDIDGYWREVWVNRET